MQSKRDVGQAMALHQLNIACIHSIGKIVSYLALRLPDEKNGQAKNKDDRNSKRMVIFQKCEHLPEPECACVRICALNATAQKISAQFFFLLSVCRGQQPLPSRVYWPIECTLFNVFRAPNERCTMPNVSIEDDTFQL